MGKPFRVLVCGGRDYADRCAVFATLDKLHLAHGEIVVIHGACCSRGQKTLLTGADRWAQEWAQENEMPYLGVPARWLTEGKAAGPKRNGRMLLYKPDRVLAFPGGAGTENMISRARSAGVEVERAQ